ncbi:MAG: Rrf2 family transcriptional regulator [Ruminococcus callidus]
MKISTKVECGIIALIDIAIHSENGEAVAVSSISKRQNISVKYLEQILVALRQTHLIRGIKGFKGGYVVARPADRSHSRRSLMPGYHHPGDGIPAEQMIPPF